MASCSSNWWHAPAYFTISLILAFMAISAALHSSSRHGNSPIKHASDELAFNISRALRKAGFNIMATLLQVSPELFLSSTNSTIFAIKDSSISNTTIPPWLLQNLLKYHTCSFSLSADDLLKKPRGSCFPTFYKKKNIAITRVDSESRLVEINHVPVSHLDIFLGETISVHGVLGPFSSLDLDNIHQGWDFIQSPLCDSNFSLVSDRLESKNTVEWSRIIGMLSSNGFVSLAIGLQSSLDGILEDYWGLDAVTIFAPPSLPFIASPPPFFKRVVRLHILPQRFPYKVLSSFPARTRFKTLVPDQNLEITEAAKSMQGLVINGVKIVAPEMMHSTKFVVHGISQAFEFIDPSSNTKRSSGCQQDMVCHILKEILDRPLPMNCCNTMKGESLPFLKYFIWVQHIV